LPRQTRSVLTNVGRQDRVEGQRLIDVFFDPAGELGIFSGPFGEPGSEITARLGEIAAIM
jgi:hypothetical protein